jgi:biopolymer transport protein ExbD
MAKVKIKRKNISLDMTAMCDVAFLLLTFFMLTTKFKPDEPVVVDTPSSTSEIKLPETGVMTISIDQDGKLFLAIDQQNTRTKTLVLMAKKYGQTFSIQEMNEFASLNTFGLSVRQIKPFLALGKEERKGVKQSGISCSKKQNELRDWIVSAKTANPVLGIAIKGDESVNYELMKQIISTLQEQNINRFHLITTLETKQS